MDKVVYKYKDEFQIDTSKDGYIVSMRIAEDDGDAIYQLLDLPKEELRKLARAICVHLNERIVTQEFPKLVHGDSWYDWMEQATFKYQFRDRVKWKGRLSTNSTGEIMEGYRAPDGKVSYSVNVDCGWDVVVTVPEELLEKIDDI